MTVSKLINRSLLLAPEEQRRDIHRYLCSRITLLPIAFHKSKNDAYIYFLGVLTSFRCSLFIALTYFGYYLLDPGTPGFIIEFDSVDQATRFLKSCSRTIGWIEVFILVPFFLCMMRYNLDLRSYNLYWMNPKFDHLKGRVSAARATACAFAFLIGVWMAFWSLSALYLTKHFFKHQLLFIAVTLATEVWISCLAMFLMLMTGISVWSYLSNRKA